MEGAGISASSLDRIRLARGIVGKASYVAAAGMAVLLTVALVLRQPVFLLIVAILAIILFAVYFSGTLWFAHKHPGLALLEGAELIQWRQMDMAARDLTELQRIGGAEPRVIGSSNEEQ